MENLTTNDQDGEPNNSSKPTPASDSSDDQPIDDEKSEE